MPPRLACLLCVLIAVPAVSPQSATQSAVQARIDKKIDWHNQMASATVSPAELDAAAARLQSMHHDAEELSVLSASVQSDLQQLQKGFLTKDLGEKLKKMEKLTKKLRRDMEP